MRDGQNVEEEKKHNYGNCFALFCFSAWKKKHNSGNCFALFVFLLDTIGIGIIGRDGLGVVLTHGYFLAITPADQ